MFKLARENVRTYDISKQSTGNQIHYFATWYLGQVSAINETRNISLGRELNDEA